MRMRLDRDDRELIPCHYCQIEFTRDNLTVDHVVPKSIGGVDLRWNWQLACYQCNLDKANKYPTCPCSFCSRTRRRHWELYKIRAGKLTGVPKIEYPYEKE